MGSYGCDGLRIDGGGLRILDDPAECSTTPAARLPNSQTGANHSDDHPSSSGPDHGSPTDNYDNCSAGATGHDDNAATASSNDDYDRRTAAAAACDNSPRSSNWLSSDGRFRKLLPGGRVLQRR